MLPDWLSQTKEIPQVPALRCTRRPGRRSFWRRTISTLADTLRKEVLAEESAGCPGILQHLDPRAKLISTAILVVALTFVHHIGLLASAVILSTLTAFASGIRPGTFIKAIAPVSILTTLLAIPSMFSFITPDPAAIHLGPVSVTHSGIHVAARFITGAISCVSVVSLLVLSTHRTSLLSAVRWFRVPQIFVMTLLMTYRYLFVLIRDAEEMHFAKDSRTIAYGGPASERAWVAGRTGDLFLRARRLSERIYLAMAARGFNGEARSLQNVKWNIRSTAAVVISVVIAALLVLS